MGKQRKPLHKINSENVDRVLSGLQAPEPANQNVLNRQLSKKPESAFGDVFTDPFKQADVLITGIDTLSHFGDRFQVQDVSTIQESTSQSIGGLQNQPTLEDMRSIVNLNNVLTQEQIIRKPRGTTFATGQTVGDRLPFLKGRDIQLDEPKVETAPPEETLLMQGVKNAVDAFGEGGRRALEGIKAVLDEPLNLRGVGETLVGGLETVINALPPVIGLNVVSPTVDKTVRNIAKEIGFDEEIASTITQKALPFVFGRWVGIGSLTAEGVSVGIKESGVLKNLSSENRKTVEDLIHNAVFLGVAGGAPKLSNRFNNKQAKIRAELDVDIKSVDKQVRESLNPKLQGEKQSDIRTPKGVRVKDKKTGKFVVKPSETKPQEGLTVEESPITRRVNEVEQKRKDSRSVSQTQKERTTLNRLRTKFNRAKRRDEIFDEKQVANLYDRFVSKEKIDQLAKEVFDHNKEVTKKPEQFAGRLGELTPEQVKQGQIADMWADFYKDKPTPPAIEKIIEKTTKETKKPQEIKDATQREQTVQEQQGKIDKTKTKEKTEKSESPQKIVESQNTRFEGIDKKGVVSFTNEKTGKTFQLHEKDVSRETVKRILDNDKGGQIEKLPPKTKTKKKKVNGRVPETWEEAVLEYFVSGGKVKDGSRTPRELRSLGLSNRNISVKRGTSIDKLITEVGFGDLSFKQNFEEGRLVSDLIDKYSTHEARVKALKELRGEEPSFDKKVAEQSDRLDEIVLNEYITPDGELRIKDIVKDSQKIANRADVDEGFILKYLNSKEQVPTKYEFPEDVFGDFKEVKNAKTIIEQTEVAKLDKSAKDIESKAESDSKEQRDEAIREADELILTSPEVKTKRKFTQEELKLKTKVEMPKKGITGEGKGEETTPLFKQKTEAKGQEKLFEKEKSVEEGLKKSRETIERLRKESRDELNNLPLGANPQLLIKSIQIGAIHLNNIIRSGVKTSTKQFNKWKQIMQNELGKKVKPHLLKIWREIKRQFGKKLGQIVESPLFPIKQTKIVEGKFLDKSPFEKPKFKEDKPIRQKDLHKGLDTPRKREVAKENKTIRGTKTADFYQELLEKKPTKKELETAVEENSKEVKYNEWMAMHKVAKDTNPLVRGAGNLIAETFEAFKKERRDFTEKRNKLLRSARNSRKKIEVIRQDDMVIDYLEGKIGKERLTTEEVKMADWLKEQFENAKETMTNKNARENYITHLRRGFLEVWEQEGFFDAVKDKFKEKDLNWEKFNVADVDQILTKELWHPFQLDRKTNLPFSRNLANITDTYFKIFYMKKHFDPVRPTIMTLNNILKSKGIIGGKNFLKTYLKTVMGEDLNPNTPKVLKKVVNGLVHYTALRYLAWNVPAGIINTVAGKFDSFINQNFPNLIRGEGRFQTKQGQKIIKEQQVVDVENMEASISMRQEFGKRLRTLLFLPMGGYGRIPFGEHYIQGTFYLGELTKAEFKSGVISPKRNREILEDIASIHGAYRDTFSPAVKNTVYGKPLLQFKLWMGAKMTNRWNRYGKQIVGKILKKEKPSPRVLRQAVKEIGAVGATLFIMMDDENPMKEMLGDVLSDLYAPFDPETLTYSLKTVAPMLNTVRDAWDLVNYLATNQRYKTNSKFGRKGDPKWLPKFKGLLPFRKFINTPVENTGIIRTTTKRKTR